MAASSRRKSFYADLDRLKHHFDALDPQKSGYIGYAELTQLVQSMRGQEESVVPELMKRLDRDKDGKVSFDDFKVLFQQEKDTGAISSPYSTADPEASPLKLSASTNLSRSLEYNTALENFPSISEINASPSHDTTRSRFDPSLAEEERDVLASPTVTLRHRPGRRGTSTKGRSYSDGGMLSPIRSNELPDLATQMRYLTATEAVDSAASPRMKRNSKVLSWISETEDQFLFEDTGTAGGDSQGRMASPPVSPARHATGSSGDEASHVKAILQSVCHSQEIGREAIARLCSHVKADPQEEQELVGLLNHLDSGNKGHVSLDEFVRGLQSVKNSAVVMETPPAKLLPRRHSEGPRPVFGGGMKFSTPKSSKPAPGPIASTPLPPASKAVEQGAMLSVLDLDNSGYVKVGSLVSEWQRLGVEAPHNTSLEELLSEAVPVDPSGRVSVTDLTTSLEGAILTEGRTQNILRQVALKSFKGEIKVLRGSIHQLSMERDQLRTSLNRTADENKRLVRDGDEQSDQIARSTEMKLREQDLLHSQKLRDLEHAQQEETQLLQERALRLVGRMEEKISALKGAEEKLRSELKYSQDELTDTTERLNLAHRDIGLKERTLKFLQKELASFTEGEQDHDDTPFSSILELQRELSDKEELMNELKEKLQELQDQSDLHTEEVEQWRQKYTSMKRKLQRRRSYSKRGDGLPSQRRRRRSTGDKEHKSPEKPAFNRPQSSFIRRPPPLSVDMDISDQEEPLSVELSEPELLPPVGPQSSESFEEEYMLIPVDEAPASSGEASQTSAEKAGSRTSDDDEDYFARSSASLLEELQIEEHKTQLEKKIDQLYREKLALQENCRKLEMQVKNLKMYSDSDELLHKLGHYRQKMAELDRQIHKLAKQRRKISTARLELDTQMARAEQQLAQQLVEIHGLRDIRAMEQAEHLAKIEQISQELLALQQQLSHEQSSHNVTVSQLREDIATLESENHFKEASFLTLKDRHEKTCASLKSLQERIDTERRVHEEQCKQLEQKMQEAEALISQHEAKHKHALHTAKKELESAQAAAAQLKLQMEALTLKFEGIQRALTQKELEVEKRRSAPMLASPLPESPASARMMTSNSSEELEIERLKKRLEQSQQKCAQAIEMNDQLQKEVEIAQTKLVTQEEAAQLDIAKLKSELDQAQKELSEVMCRHEVELSQLEAKLKSEVQKCNHKAEGKLAAVTDLHLKRLEAVKQKHELQLEAAKHELKSSELQAKNLQEKLSEVTIQCDKSLAEVAKLKEREIELQGQVTSLEQRSELYKSDIAQLKIDIDKYKEDLSVSLDKERQHLNDIVALKGQLRVHANQLMQYQELPTEEPDTTEIIASPRSSIPYTPLVHDGIISEMKSQLEDLQKLLVFQGRPAKDNEKDELSIVQELLSANEQLRVEMKDWRSKVEREKAELAETVSRKDCEFERLATKVDDERKCLKELTVETSRIVLEKAIHLEHTSKQALADYQDRINGVSTKLAAVSSSLKDRDFRHSNALDGMLTDLDQSRSEIDNCKQEMERMKEAFDQSLENLNQSQSQQQPAADHDLEDKERVCAGHLEEELRQRDNELEERGAELQELRAEVGRLSHSELQLKQRLMALQTDIQQRNSELSEHVDGIVTREEQIRGLEERLRQLALKPVQEPVQQELLQEPLECAVQIMQLQQPLESVSSEASSSVVMARLQREAEAERERARRMETLHQAELLKLNEDLNRSLSDSEQLVVVMQLLEDAQQRLTLLEEENLALQRKHDTELNLLHGELNQDTQDLRDLHEYLVQPLEGSGGVGVGGAGGREGGGEGGEEDWLPDHAQLITEMRAEVETLKTELYDERVVCVELEALLQSSTEDHDQQDAQFHTEHEEEVRALRQQKHLLQRQLEDLKEHYQQLVDEQDERHTVLLQDLVNNKAELEKQIHDKTEEGFMVYQRLSDLLEERNILMDLVKELSLEAGRQIDIV